MLCGCLGDIDGSDNRKEIEQIGIISDNSSETTIISTGWKEEEIYKEITDSCLIDNFCMKRILLMCNYADYENYDALSNIVPTRCFGNWRYCFVLEDGYVYCANIYHDFSPGKEVFYSSMLDELLTDEDKWHELQDIFCIGRVSSVEMQELKSYINNIFLYC